VTYAIIKVGGRQYRVEEGEYFLVDRLPYDEGAIFQPNVLAIGVDGELKLGDDEVGSAAVTARVTEHLRGPKVVVGKHRQRTGYRRRNGFRASLSRVEIESIGGAPKTKAKKAASGSPKKKAAATTSEE